jgi:hypothetical protein
VQPLLVAVVTNGCLLRSKGSGKIHRNLISASSFFISYFFFLQSVSSYIKQKVGLHNVDMSEATH